MPQHDMVGMDRGSPPQNPVPKSTGRPPYQQDPFQTAQVQEGTGEAYTQSGLGFGVKDNRPQYTRDPFDQAQPYQPKYLGEEDAILEEFGTPELIEQRDERDRQIERTTRLDDYRESGEITTENIPDIYSLTEDELPEYGIDISAENVGEAPEGIVSGWNDADGDGYDDDGHAMGTHGAVNVQTKQGQDSIEAILADPSAGLPGQNWWEQGLHFADSYAQPRQRMLDNGEVVTTSPGGAVSAALPGGLGIAAAIGGGLSAANLNRIQNEYGEYNPEAGLGYIGRDSAGAGTPLAISEGFIPNTTVVSGNTDLAIRNNPALDVNGDGQLNSLELRDALAAREQVEAEQARQAELDRIAQQDRALAEAARRAEEEAARQRQEQLAAEQRRAEEAARREAERQANLRAAEEEARRQEDARRAEAQRRANETGRDQTYGGGSAVTDSRGNPVRDSSGGVVTDRHETVRPESDSGGGGGGDSCFSAGAKFLMHDGRYKEIQDIKVGDIMKEGGRVYGVLQGDGSIEDWYIYNDVYVTGSHFVYENKRWIPVAKSEKAELLWGGFDTWYCVLNNNHRMVSAEGTLFTDFDAVDSVNDELEERLNGGN